VNRSQKSVIRLRRIDKKTLKCVRVWIIEIYTITRTNPEIIRSILEKCKNGVIANRTRYFAIVYKRFNLITIRSYKASLSSDPHIPVMGLQDGSTTIFG